MKRLFFILLIIAPIMGMSQGRKDIRDNGIKKCSIYNVSVVDGKEVKRLETIIKYNEAGREIEEVSYDKKTGKINKTEVYEYDANGNKSKVIEKNAAGKVVKTYVYKYDTKEFRVEKQIMDENGKMKSKDVYVYEKQ